MHEVEQQAHHFVSLVGLLTTSAPLSEQVLIPRCCVALLVADISFVP